MKLKFLLILFFVVAFCLPGFAQVILAPDLQCVQNDQVNGDILLSWTNPPANPCGAFAEYTIYTSKTGPGGPFDSVSVTNQAATSQLLTGYLGISPTWYFYMVAKYNCPGATVLSSDTVNNLNPTTPTIVNVEVTANGDVIFNWEPGPSPQTQCYIIYYYLPNGLAVPLDTVCGYSSSTYLDVIGDPTTGSLVYTIAAVDSCGKISAYSTSPHNTIYATAGTVACQSQVNLAWNRYINWPQSVLRYEVWVSRNDSAFSKVADVDTTNLVYNYTGFDDGDSLQIYIRAVSAAD
ncbi:MAG TPA: hypothetical protein VK174_18715, partial [Chitinophagales bacterium]|nr:hypothetical protein [Chitinophagales bacterium]